LETREEASAKCDKEPMNFLALNLFNDVVTRKRTVQDARMFYAETAEKFNKYNVSSPYTEGFLFPLQTNTADPDVSLI
jgi:hypothetical protein